MSDDLLAGLDFGDPCTAERADSLRDLLPALQGHKSVVSIGEEFRPSWRWWLTLFGALDFTEFSVLEVYKPNVEVLRDHEEIGRVYHCNVLDCHMQDADPADVVLWWHGPEHLGTADSIVALANLQVAFDPKVLILGMPWGKYDNSHAHFKNKHAYHLSSWYPKLLNELGFETRTVGAVDVKGSHISAWKRT